MVRATQSITQSFHLHHWSAVYSVTPVGDGKEMDGTEALMQSVVSKVPFIPKAPHVPCLV